MNAFPIQAAATGLVKHNGSAFVMKDGVASSVIKVSSEACTYSSRLGTPQYCTKESDPPDLELNFPKVHVHRHQFVALLPYISVLVVILFENEETFLVAAVFLLQNKFLLEKDLTIWMSVEQTTFLPAQAKFNLFLEQV